MVASRSFNSASDDDVEFLLEDSVRPLAVTL